MMETLTKIGICTRLQTESAKNYFSIVLSWLDPIWNILRVRKDIMLWAGQIGIVGFLWLSQ